MQRSVERAVAGERERLRRCADALRAHAEITAILVAHLRAVVERTESAATEIVGHMSAAQAEVAGIVAALQTATTEGHRSSEITAADVVTLRESIDHRATALAKERDRLSQMVRGAQEMKLALKGMGDFVMSTKILALNARVEAARAGDHGRAFAVVASEMDRVAEMTKSVTGEAGQRASGLAQAISATVEQQMAESTKAEQSERAALAAVAEDLCQMSGALMTKNALLDDLAGKAGALSQHTMEGLASVQFQDVVRQRVDLVVGVLESLEAQVYRMAAYAEGEIDVDFEAELAEVSAAAMNERYVMEAQRSDHRAALGLKPAANERPPDIELF